jgi:glucokinase
MENFARMLGIGIANYVNIFEPERLAIGGGLSRASHLFMDRAIQEAAPRALPALWKRVHVALAEGGADAGVIGAGLLAAVELERDRDTDLTKATTSEGIE